MFDGLAKKKFEDWLHNTNHMDGFEYKLGVFTEMPLACQWGVIQDFADSLGLEIETDNIGVRGVYWHCSNRKTAENYMALVDTRQEARTEAVKKLNELINSK